MDFYPYDLNKLLFKNEFRARWNNLTFDRLLNGIICGMRFLHQSGLIHRDLKPHNVLVTDQMQAKIADFGIAFREHVHTDAIASNSSKIPIISDNSNLAGQYAIKGIEGTPFYMSPEIIPIPMTKCLHFSSSTQHIPFRSLFSISPNTRIISQPLFFLFLFFSFTL